MFAGCGLNDCTFQSTPGLTVGRCAVSRISTRRLAGFNPRPASRSGDALQNQRQTFGTGVSIHARPHGRAMLPHRQSRQRKQPVSIHARPHGRAMHAAPTYDPRIVGFNPRPASRSGDAVPIPAFPADCSVSIHARPHGRAMRMQAELERYKADLFQSTPGLTVGRCVQAGHRQFDVGQFQSTPGLTVGRCPCRRSASRIRYCFNPRPASRSGDAGNKLHVFRFRRVSIHARPHGRAMRGEHRYKERKLYGFNPRPASRSGDAPDLPPEGHPLRVSIHEIGRASCRERG